jgi:energy-coupling factor transporter ATP-binding protein EcfA2
LDECTASVDTQTASVIQNAISTECRGMTVITIAHRISMVLNMDNILILDRGILVCFLYLYVCPACMFLFFIVDSFVFSPAAIRVTLEFR